MYNKTSATLMLQTIMVLMEKQNATDVTFPGTYGEDIERCYDKYGCFSKAYPWTEKRPDNYFPVPPESMGVRYPTFSRRNRKIPVLLDADNIDKIQNANIDPRGPFYLISHGFLDGGHKLWLSPLATFPLVTIEKKNSHLLPVVANGKMKSQLSPVVTKGTSQSLPVEMFEIKNARLLSRQEIENMVNALLNLEGNDAATVFIVDWRGGAQPPYGQAVANIRLVGVMTAHLVHNIYEALGLPNLDNFHFIGHSLGAHLGGYCGHALQKKFSLKLGRISGLDPAAPYFSKTVTLVRLDRTDAKYVDIIHSNAVPLYFSGFGISEPIGHVDFYPNGGATQPGCKPAVSQRRGGGDMYQNMQFVSCNHERSYDYFTESIAPSCPFLAVQCESYEAFLAGNCTTCDHKHSCIPMGYHSYEMYKRLQLGGFVDTNSNMALYSMTGGAKPFCRAHYEVNLKVSNSTESHTHGPETGKLSITLVDRNNNKSDTRFLDDEQKYYKPGDIETRMVAVKDTGHPPLSVIVEWKYETNLFNPMTWRILKSPSIFVEYMKISSIEYNTVITVCPKNNKPVVANLPTMMKTKYCKFNT